MTRNEVRSAARKLGLGLVAVAMGTSAAIAGPKPQGAQCPFSSKDVDGWYKAIGFDTGADDAGRPAMVECTVDTMSGTFATLSETEKRMGPKVVDGATVDALSTFKQIVINISTTGWGGEQVWKYDIGMVRDGAAYPPASDTAYAIVNSGNPVPISEAEAAACITELTSSQAWNRWSCGKQ